MSSSGAPPKPEPNLGPLQKAIVALDAMKAKVDSLERERTEPIAIIGMACRFPGGIDSPDAFYDFLTRGNDAVTTVPSDRWLADALDTSSLTTDAQRKAIQWGAFLTQDPRMFDAGFFEIAPREALHLDPQQRLLLEVTWEALEAAGQDLARLSNSSAAAFIGIMNSDYAQMCARAGIEDIYVATGNGHCFPPGRLAFAFGLQGPAMAVDTACSSSLVALHLACQSLRNGESKLAVAGGVNLMLSPAMARLTATTNGLSPDGRCKTFDASANGFVRGEGCGIVVLKRLSAAQRDRDPILAVIRSSALNQDGRSTGLTVPNVISQENLLRTALAQAKLSATDIGYIEMHGTGTPLGDPIEAEALHAVLGNPRPDGSKCVLGAVKTNIGHLESAAGIAGVIKAVVALQREAIPGNIHFRALNPRISLSQSCFVFPTTITAWPRSHKARRAGISSFGMSGTNAHVILEEASLNEVVHPPKERSAYLLPLSAKTQTALIALAQLYAEWFSQPNNTTLHDIVYTASARRTHHEHRFAAVAGSREEFVTKLGAFARGESPHGVVQGQARPGKTPRLVFVFSGQGSQWPGMGRALYKEEPLFQSKLKEIDALVKRHAAFSILDELEKPEDTSRLGETAIVQPVLFAIQVGLAELFRSWGIVPDAVIGHSIGEAAAACVSGAISLEDAVRLVVLRGKIMQKATGLGKMVWVGLAPDKANQAIAGLEDEVSIAAINDPSSVVLSGDIKTLDAVVADLSARGVATRPLRVNYAFHSPQMATLASEFAAALGSIQTNPPAIAMYSTVTGALIDESALDVHYWERNIRATVNLAAAVQAALADGHRTLVEIGPHPVLLANLQQCAAAMDIEARTAPTLRRQADAFPCLQESLGFLHVNGGELDWKKVFPDAGRVVALPNYPWQRERYWIESASFAPKEENSVHDSAALNYTVEWEPMPASSTITGQRPKGAWLILSGESNIGEEVITDLRAAGATCVRVQPGLSYARLKEDDYRIDIVNFADYERLVQDLAANGVSLVGVVHLLNLDAAAWDRTTIELLDDTRRRGVVSTLYLTQALARTTWRDKPRLWLVSRGAVSTGMENSIASVSQAPLWGLGRTIMVEHPELDCTCIDLDPDSDINAAPSLAEQLVKASREPQIALRRNARYVARLVRARMESRGSVEFEFRADATYLITGGLGGLGLSAAEWMVEAGARHVALLARRSPSEAAGQAIERMQRAGANVVVFSCDISEPADVSAVLSKINAEMPPLRGILHAAGILDDRMLLDLSEEHFARVFAAKVFGAWTMHSLTKNLTLDFFVLYSSVASLFGSAGQSNYAAANAFLDALAHARRAMGLPGTSIHWGPFSDVGMAAAQHNRGERIAHRGLENMSPADGNRILAHLLTSIRAEVAPLRLDVRQWMEYFPIFAAQPFWSKLAKDRTQQATQARQRGHFRRSLENQPTANRGPSLEEHVREQVGHVLHMEPNGIERAVPFRTLGVDSLMSLEVRNRLESSFDLKLPATLLFTYPNLESLTTFLLNEIGLLTAAKDEHVEATDVSSVHIVDEPIAIIGQACRFPGGGSDPERFWQVLLSGVDAVRDVSPLRWPVGTIPADKPGAGYAALLDRLDLFDAAFFGISPREAEALDPQQRMLLEVTWEALENAGERPNRLIGSQTGVFVGITALDYQRIVQSHPEHLDAYGATGTMLSTAAGRLSYVLGFQGPAVALDTACSSSLVALHLACRSLRDGESSLAVAGGANALIAAENMIMLSSMRALSPDGRCKTLDARANGYVRGEGCGIVVLKRLSDAKRDGDRILGLIRGTAMNQDGRSTGLTAPNVLAQQALLEQALENAHLHAAEIGFIEMHGTGTPLGDPIEADALRHVFGKPRADGTNCFLGAVKTNIGHLESAAGIAGVIKALQSLQHEMVPGNLHFRALNPRISFDETPLVIPTEPMAWPRGKAPRRAGVSSFGMSGTNAHVILEEAPLDDAATTPAERSAYLLPLSAKTPEALTDLAQSYVDWLSQPNGPSLHDIVYTASARRMHHEHRLAVVAASSEEFVKQLQSFTQGETNAGVTQGSAREGQKPRIIFVFPGQGSQWLGMGRQLLEEEPAFRAALKVCEPIVQAEAGFSILEQLAANEHHSRLHEIDVVQPILFALEVALAELWRSWGVIPDCVVGHSMGEVAAAYIAGMLSLEDAANVICRRSRLLKRISGNGAMALVELPLPDAEAAIRGFENELGIAVSNGPRSTVLSGDPNALEFVIASLEKKGVFCRRVKVDVASHSPQVEILRQDLLDSLADVQPTVGTVPMRSTVTGDVLQGPELVAQYWADNLRQPVRFSQVTQDLLRIGHHLFVEISPHPILLPSIEENIKWLNADGAAFASMRRGVDEYRTLLEAFGALYTQRWSVDWNVLYPKPGRPVTLPLYPWQRERFWVERSTQRSAAQGEHPLLGTQFVTAIQPQLHVWQQWLSVRAFPYLADYRVKGQIVFPRAAYVEMALAAATSVYGRTTAILETITVEQPLSINPNEVVLIQVSLMEEGDGCSNITVATKSENATDWIRCASGVAYAARIPSGSSTAVSRRHIELRCPKVIEFDQHYAEMQLREFQYGSAFQWIREIRVGSGEVLARAHLPNDIPFGATGYLIHPALLDACFQAALWLFDSEVAQELSFDVNAVRMYDLPRDDIWIHARLEDVSHGQTPTIRINAYNEQERLIFEVGELRANSVPAVKPQKADPFTNQTFELAWKKLEHPPKPTTNTLGQARWVVLSDSSGFGSNLARTLRTQGAQVVEVRVHDEYERVDETTYQLRLSEATHWTRFFATACGKSGCQGVIDCLSLDGATFPKTSASTLTTDIQQGVLGTVHAVQAILQQGWRDTPRLYVVTRGAQAVESTSTPLSLSQSISWGLGRAIMMEQPDLRCVMIDLAPELDPADWSFVISELTANTDEDHIAYRPTGRYVARLVRAQWDVDGPKERLEPAAGRPYRLDISKPGALEQLSLRPFERTGPLHGEVEIEVEAAGICFNDVLKSLGSYASMDAPPFRLGTECAGRVLAVGDGVTSVSVGQSVIALASSSLATHVTVPAEFVVMKPDNITFEQAATIPTAFLTAYWALHHVARLQRGERILIHCATGGVGLAAIQYARAIGAEVFATAGSDAKRSMLRSMGIAQAMDSRSLAFIDEIMAVTKGRGVDVVLNSLTGDALMRSLDILAPYGRFIEIGKKDAPDNRHLGIQAFRNAISFTSVDVAAMADKKPHVARDLLREVMAKFADGTFTPESVTMFSANDVQNAFRMMARAEHTGKLAIRMGDPHTQVVTTHFRKISMRADGTYLVVGGLEGFGLSLASSLVQTGAKHVLVVGPNPPDLAAESKMAEMRAMGAQVLAMQASVEQREQVDRVLAQLGHDMPPLVGVVLAMPTFAANAISEMDEFTFFTALAPNVFGAWNLHEATRNLHLDFFVTYSAGAGRLASPKQSHLAAASTFLDALSYSRMAEGLTTTSIQWSGFADSTPTTTSGMRRNDIVSPGTAAFENDEGTAIFARVLASPRPEIAILHFDARQWTEVYPHMAGTAYLAELVQENGKRHTQQQGTLRKDLEALSAQLRLGRMETHLLEELGRVLRLDPRKIDKRAPFANLGIDSLMSLDLRNRLEASTDLKLSATLLFTYATPLALASHLVERLFPITSPQNDAPTELHVPTQDLLGQSGDESANEQHDDALMDKLGEFEEFLQ